MARPAWQVFQARELAGRMGSTPESHIAGALIMRHLVARNPQVGAAMAVVPAATQEEYSGADKPDAFIAAMSRMWTAVGVRLAPGATARDPEVASALWTLARVAYLDLPPQEIDAAHEIAAQSKLLPRFGAEIVKTERGVEERWGGGWETTSGAWEGLHGLELLRTDLYNATPEPYRAAVMAEYDILLSSTAERQRWVEKWQRWAQAQGRYTGEIDGLWGPGSESAWISLLPRSYGRATTLEDLRALNYGGIEMFALLAAGLARDKWIADNPSRLPPRPAPGEEPVVPSDASRVVVTTPKPPTVPEETITVEPGAGEGGAVDEVPPRVDITLPSGEAGAVTVTAVEEGGAPAKRNWLPWVLGGGAVAALVVGAVVASKPAARGEARRAAP